MKKLFAVLLFLLIEPVFANSNFAYLLGMRNNRYAFMGIEYSGKVGMVVENSLFTQGVEKQYIRLAPYYRWNIGKYFEGSYIFFVGMRYDGNYYDLGSRLDFLWLPFYYFQIGGSLMPYYDSVLKRKIGYKAYAQSFVFQDVGLFIGVKNLPDFRETENRYIGGIVIKSGRIWVKPELSVPMSRDSHLTRVSVFFVYNSR